MNYFHDFYKIIISNLNSLLFKIGFLFIIRMFIVIIIKFIPNIIVIRLFYAALIFIMKVSFAFLLLITIFLTFTLHFFLIFIVFDVMSGFISLI